MEKQYVNEAWLVGIKNYKPASGITQMEILERHNLTDELFIPVAGESILVVAAELDGTLDFYAERMEISKIYCVGKGEWHNVVMRSDAKLVLVERPDTGMGNSEIRRLSENELARMKALVLNRTFNQTGE